MSTNTTNRPASQRNRDHDHLSGSDTPTTHAEISVSSINTPVGTVRVASQDGTVLACGFADHWETLMTGLEKRLGPIVTIEEDTPAGDALSRYVAGDLTAMDTLPVDPGGTDFQAQVWATLRTIPVGETYSYGELAERIGSPGAMRAVGSANGANPISLIIPCHRVIRSDGNLGGYGGGLDRKAWLLSHEGALLT